ncbi:hypothetical protein [Actinomadura rudentiformis]|uniref:Uncharacterized protein n=1 Tax=Actinomadura rudentiformis TaxID=359158 RepID=A0A6H9YTA3_9ACTN|nr:hypothetical protein [Actinomadura rudentiformis]KAB2350111.1 hypothetical protein F8566_09885 [Actinomadura rudentiformis]
MHTPGEPSDLEEPRVLWARAATTAIACAAGLLSANVVRLRPDGLNSDASGAGWWTLTLSPDEEAVFSGQDDFSHTHLGDEPVDLLAGLPDRLSWPQLREDLRARALGFVYWYTGGAWHRAPYPEDLEDDGLDASLSFLADEAELTIMLVEDHPRTEDAGRTVAGFLDRAKDRRLHPDDVIALLAAINPQVATDPARVKAALDMATRTGLLEGTTPPLFTADV